MKFTKYEIAEAKETILNAWNDYYFFCIIYNSNKNYIKNNFPERNSRRVEQISKSFICFCSRNLKDSIQVFFFLN